MKDHCQISRWGSLILVLVIQILAGGGVALDQGLVIDLNGYRFDPVQGGAPPLPADLTIDPNDKAQPALVQLQGPIVPEWREQLESIGVTIHDYIPEFAYLVTMDQQAGDLMPHLPFVRWVGPYHPAYRISPRIGGFELVDPERRDDPFKKLTVQVFGNPSLAAVELEGLGLEVIEVVDDLWTPRLVVRALPEMIPVMARQSLVRWIEEVPDFTTQNNNTRWVVQSNLSGQTPLWDHNLHGENEIVTMMDTGLDYNSCWFRENGNAAPNPNHRKVIDYKTWGGSAYDGCGTGHGTHVAGTCTGDQSYINPGNDNYNGLAYRARITVQDVGNDDFFSCLLGLLSVPSSLTSAFSDAYTLGSRIHTNSWGSSSNSYDTHARDVDNFMWSNKDFLAVFAAGNYGPGSGTVGSPATAKNCISVGATRQAPQQETIAGYSSRGPADDNRYKPTLTAPGGEDPNFIFSADNNTGNPPSPTCSVVGSPFQGTSMAAPAVSGSALLVRQYYREGWYPSGAPVSEDGFIPSAALIKATMINSAADMGAADIPNNTEGWGRLLLDNALYFPGDSRFLRIEDETVGLQTGEVDVYSYVVNDGEPFEIVLVWTDYPAATGSGTKLVNDLDLEVEVLGGGLFRGNVFYNGESGMGGTADRLNVEEVVLLNSPGALTYTIRVIAHNVPQGGRQPYALVGTGAFPDWPPHGSSAPENPGPFRRISLQSHPNPFGTQTQLTYRIPGAAVGRKLQLEIVDISGRRIRTLFDGPAGSSGQTLSWDGRDRSGRLVPSGIYFAVLQSLDHRVQEKLIRLQ
ncbi:MAG: S8 family serine peptidase [Candidatus Eisenbacteria bacterium]|nr:S8 family serine peptidase [Candidatus Eisenbacteria bacterium]MBU1947963.1 S8 family serine peptidase [Candidatus Eisenbacteria bacterium]